MDKVLVKVLVKVVQIFLVKSIGISIGNTLFDNIGFGIGNAI